jgi:transcription initiation factor TFIIH subunit 2
MSKKLKGDDEGVIEYQWEQGMKRTWDLQEDEAGNLIVTTSSDHDRAKRAKLKRLTQSVRRGLIRYLVLFLDCSASARENDYRPSRFEEIKKVSEKFVLEYFDQNPISQLSVSITRERIAEKITDLSG